MEYTALWGPKGFIVSPSKIVPLLNLSTSFAVKADNGNDTSGTSATNTKGRELQKVSLSTLYVRGAGVDPRGQIAEWEALVGKSYPLYIEGNRFGPDKLMLKSVNVSDILLSNTGKFLKAAIALEFEEYSDQTTAKSTTGVTSTATSSSSSAKAAASYKAITEQKKKALNATPKRTAKAAVLAERKLNTR
jgi:hypothetical protein